MRYTTVSYTHLDVYKRQIQGIFRGNFLLFGLPLALNMFGQEGVMPTALLLPVAIPLYNVLAVVILTHFGGGGKGLAIKPMLMGIIRNPLILASLLGILVSFMPFSFPEFLSAALDDIGAVSYTHLAPAHPDCPWRYSPIAQH